MVDFGRGNNKGVAYGVDGSSKKKGTKKERNHMLIMNPP